MATEPARGFTLLELLVVLTLMSLLAGLVVPRLTGALEQRQHARQLAELERRLHALPLRAAVEQNWFELGPDPAANAAVLDLPPEWLVTADRTIEIRPDGACSAGLLEVEGPHGLQLWELTAPLCRVQR